MQKTLADIAAWVGGELKGDPRRLITGAATLAEAVETDISFVGNPKYLPLIKTTKAGALLVSPDANGIERDRIVLKNPVFGWAKVLELIEKDRRPPPATGIHPTAVIAKSAKLGKDVAVGAYAVIEEGVSIGDRTVIMAHCYIGHQTTVGQDCLIYPRVVIRERVHMGNRCILQPGVVLGSDGYGFTWNGSAHYKVPQVGGLVIADDVEIQANSTVDRGAVGDTQIGAGCKIDNLVQVAHNVEMGTHVLIAAQTGIAGSAKIGNGVVIAAQVGMVGHIKIGDRAILAARAGVTNDVAPGAVVFGSPAQPIKDEMKMQAACRRLPKLLAELNDIRKKLGIAQ